MKITIRELSVYVALVIIIFIYINLPAVKYDYPDLTPPTQQEPASSTTQQPDQNYNLFGTILQTILFGLIVFVIYIMAKNLGAFNFMSVSRKSREKKLSEKERVKRLKDARERAYKILNEGLTVKNYTQAYIDAYMALDNDLSSFREELSRPEFWTPKEYAIAVQKPIYKPAVYKFIKKYYDIRYGSFTANENDIHEFIESLNLMFENEVPSTIREQMNLEFENNISEVKTGYIPKKFDPTRPGGLN